MGFSNFTYLETGMYVICK